MTKYLLNEDEVRRLADRLDVLESIWPSLKHDEKIARPSHFPLRFKLLESLTGGSASAAIYYFGYTTNTLHATDDVIDDSSQFSEQTSGAKGVCLASSAYHILEFNPSAPESSTAIDYIGLATTDYATTDTTVTIDNLEPMQGVGTTETSLDADNTFSWDVVNNQPCYIKYNFHSSNYELLQTYCS